MKRLLLAAAAACLYLFAGAEEFPVPKRPLTALDSLAVSEIRARLAEIKKTRPSVALVLSGGGAKGAAHIGVIKYLEQIEMPVDVVLGTSMGGLVGGMYALGYGADRMDSIIRSIQWNPMLTDKLQREYISYSEMKYKERYLMNFPFYYERTDVSGQEYADRTPRKNRIGLSDEDGGDGIGTNLLGSLPSGYAKGQNVFNLITSLSVGYQDTIAFSRLPVPFMCVATDLVSGRGVYMYSGKLTSAMRSTMSIPVLFAPVKTDGMVLVDGGMRDNFPVAAARELGADIVIGVDLGGEDRTFEQINNIGDIVMQGVEMLGRPAYRYNTGIADLCIKPVLTGYNMLSFDSASIDVLLSRGYEAALDNADALDELRRLTGPATAGCRMKPATDINTEPVLIESIEIVGVPEKEKSVLMDRIKLRPGDRLSRNEAERIVGQISGTKAYEYVSYELDGTHEPYRLVIHCRKGPIHRFGVGLRMDTEEISSVLLNIGLNSRKLYGSTYDFTGKISANPYARFQYSYDGARMPTITVSASFKWANIDMLEDIGLNMSDFHLKYFDMSQEAYLSRRAWSLFDFRGGLRNRYFKVRSLLSQDFIHGEYDLKRINNDFISVFAEAGIDNFDHGYFPKSGVSAGLSYEWVFYGHPNKINNFHIVSADAKVVIPAEKVFAFIPSAGIRFLLGGDDIPLAYVNAVGGSMAGRYFDHQMAFVGKNNVAAMRTLLAMLRADLRFEVAKHHYVTGIVNYARDCDSFSEFVSNGHGWIGAGVEYAYDAFFGPVRADLHWSSITGKPGFYIGIGYNF